MLDNNTYATVTIYEKAQAPEFPEPCSPPLPTHVTFLSGVARSSNIPFTNLYNAMFLPNRGHLLKKAI